MDLASFGELKGIFRLRTFPCDDPVPGCFDYRLPIGRMVAVVGRDAEVDDLRGSEVLDEGAADDPFFRYPYPCPGAKRPRNAPDTKRSAEKIPCFFRVPQFLGLVSAVISPRPAKIGFFPFLSKRIGGKTSRHRRNVQPFGTSHPVIVYCRKNTKLQRESPEPRRRKTLCPESGILQTDI